MSRHVAVALFAVSISSALPIGGARHAGGGSRHGAQPDGHDALRAAADARAGLRRHGRAGARQAARAAQPAATAARPSATAARPSATADGATAPAPANLAAPAPAVPPNLSNEWSYYQEKDGTYWRMRKHGSTLKPVWATGIALVVATFAASIPLQGYAPVVGGFIAAGFNDDPTLRGLMIVDGLIGVTGAIMIATGLTWGKGGVERQPITVTPTAMIGGGGGAALSVRF